MTERKLKWKIKHKHRDEHKGSDEDGKKGIRKRKNCSCENQENRKNEIRKYETVYFFFNFQCIDFAWSNITSH